MTSATDSKRKIPFNGLFYLFFVLTFASLHFTVSGGSNGNLEQWLNLTNQMFYGHQDFLFTRGPLYWMSGGGTSQYSVTSYWIAVLFVSAVYASVWAAVVWMASEARSTAFFAALYILFFQGVSLSSSLFFLWPFILVVYLDLYRNACCSRKEYFFYGALVALFFYIRFFYGVVALATFGTYLVSMAVANKNWRGIVYLFFGLTVSYSAIGLFVFHDYSSIVNYVLINNQLSLGNSVDMTMDVVNKPQTWVAVAVCAIALSVYAFIKRKRLFLTVAVLILFFLKLGFSRTDHYLVYFVGPLSFMLLLPLLDRSVFGRGVVVVSAICLCYLSVSPSFPRARVRVPLQPGVNFHVSYEDRMQDVYKDFRLSPGLLNYIGDETIDFYPYNHEYAFANKLNYKYRPVFQNYMTLTPKLDAMNQAFLESPDRPQFILWTAGIVCNAANCNPFDAFDRKYTLNEDPLTTSAIFCNYHKVATAEGKGGVPLMLLEKNESVRECPEVFIKSEKLEFGKWYSVPAVENGLLKLRPELEFTAYGKIKNLLFRGSILRIKYKLATGIVKTYRLNILNSRSGIVVSPLLDNFDYSGPRVDEIMFETNDERYFKPFFDAQWITMPEPEVKTRNPWTDFFLTDRNWVNGIARHWAGFFVPNTEKYRAKFKKGNTVIFSNGDKRSIVRVAERGHYLHIWVDGAILNSKDVGIPSEFEVLQ